MLVPGYLAGDGSLATMTHWLRRAGHRTSRAGIRSNVDCSEASTERLLERLERFAERHGRRVAVIGQSRGGNQARVLAVRRPDLVSGVIVLGSPTVDPLAVNPLVRLNLAVVGALGSVGAPGLLAPGCLDGDCCRDFRAETSGEFPRGVGFVAIYSRSDGIVDWRACLDPAAEHVEVRSTHCGMSVNVEVYRAVADELARLRERESTPGRGRAGARVA